ncbi:hypothetical protein KC220_24705, partial [Mycobacterium tuberculosis]|nr:hypothetical protein [Mycobacterium tuberculosis]
AFARCSRRFSSRNLRQGSGIIIVVPPYAQAVSSFWKDRLASGPRAAQLPPVQQLLGNMSVPFDLKRTRAQAALLAGQMQGDGRNIL